MRAQDAVGTGPAARPRHPRAHREVAARPDVRAADALLRRAEELGATRCVLTLEREGYLQRDDTSGRYMTGMKLGAVGRHDDRRRGAARASRAGAASAGGGSADDGAPGSDRSRRGDGGCKVDRARRTGSWPPRVGKRMDAHCTSLGKCLIAHIPDEDVDRLHWRTRAAPPQRAHDRLAARLKQELARIRCRRLCARRRGRGAGRALHRRARLESAKAAFASPPSAPPAPRSRSRRRRWPGSSARRSGRPPARFPEDLGLLRTGAARTAQPAGERLRTPA